MLYCFNKNEELIHEFGSGQLQKCTQIEELNKVMILEFSVYLSSYEARQALKDMEFVAHKDMENPEKIQMYRVISSETDSFTINFQAVHVLFDDLKSYGYIGNKKGENIKASSALELVLEGSRWKVGRVDDSVVKTLRFHYVNRLEGLSTILNTWGMELSYDLEFNGSIITARTVNLLAQRGEDTGERFVYGSNALEVVKELDKSEIYTQIVPRGKVEEKAKNELKTDNRRKMDNLRKRESPVSDRNVEEKEENRVDITSIGWSKAEGKPIDKPKGQEFIELSDRTKIFGYSDGKPRTKVVVFEDVEKPEDLIQAGYNYLVEVSRPLAQFKTKVYKKSLTNVGDIVRVIRKDLDIYYQTRIYKATRNILTGSVEVEFGDKLILSPGERQRNILDSIGALENRMERKEAELKGSFVDKVTEELTNATFNRDGFNYELKAGNKYKLPAGYYSFDREIDDNPQRVIYVGAGTLAIADSKKSNGDWNFRTFGTGKGFVADLLLAGTILGGKVRWNLEDGTFIIGNSTKDYNLYWDGGTLHLRNVDIDLENNRTIQNIQNKQGVIDQQITDRKNEIAQANLAIQERKEEIEGAKEKLSQIYDEFSQKIKASDDSISREEKARKDKEKLVDVELLNLSTGLTQQKTALGSFEKDMRIKTKTLSEEVLEAKTNIKVTDDKISTSVGSLSKTIQEKALEAKTHSEDLFGNSKTYTDLKVKDIREYISKNYTSIDQTDKKIELTAGEIKARVDKNIDTALKLFKDSYGKEVDRRFELVKADLSDLDKDLGLKISKTDKSLGLVKADLSNLDDVLKESNRKFEVYKQEKSNRDVILDKELLEIQSKLKVTNDKISSTVSSITKTVEAKVEETKTYAKNLLGDSKTYTDSQVKDMKTYVTKNYASLYQTDNMINAKVGKIKADVNAFGENLIKQAETIDETLSQVKIAAGLIIQKVSKGEVISEINQSPEQVKIKASKIDFEGNVTVKGDFKTSPYGDSSYVHMFDNRIRWYDDRWSGYILGEINVARVEGSDKQFSLNFGHYPTGTSMVSYYRNDTKLWHPYITFDKWGIKGYGSDRPIIVHENINMLSNTISLGKWDIISKGEELRIKPRDSNSGIIFNRDGLYAYYASGGRDVYKEIKRI